MPVTKPSPMDRVCLLIRTGLVERHGDNGVRRGFTAAAGAQSPDDVRAALAAAGVRVLDEDWAIVVAACALDKAAPGSPAGSPLGGGQPAAGGRFDAGAMVSRLLGVSSPARRLVLRSAWQQLQKAAGGAPDAPTVPLGVVQDLFDASRLDEVQTRRVPLMDAVASFLAAFSAESNPTGDVTRQEFEAYYAGLGLRLADDQAFQRHVLRSWNLDKPGVTVPQRDPDAAAYDATGTVTGQLGGRTHPLYRSSASDIGGRLQEAEPVDGRFNLNGAFTNNSPGFTAGTGLNTGTTRSRV